MAKELQNRLQPLECYSIYIHNGYFGDDHKDVCKELKFKNAGSWVNDGEDKYASIHISDSHNVWGIASYRNAEITFLNDVIVIEQYQDLGFMRWAIIPN